MKLTHSSVEVKNLQSFPQFPLYPLISLCLNTGAAFASLCYLSVTWTHDGDVGLVRSFARFVSEHTERFSVEFGIRGQHETLVSEFDFGLYPFNFNRTFVTCTSRLTLTIFSETVHYTNHSYKFKITPHYSLQVLLQPFLCVKYH
jgi:hypothetical protein